MAGSGGHCVRTAQLPAAAKPLRQAVGAVAEHTGQAINSQAGAALGWQGQLNDAGAEVLPLDAPEDWPGLYPGERKGPVFLDFDRDGWLDLLFPGVLTVA